jgi:hypothetical protein
MSVLYQTLEKHQVSQFDATECCLLSVHSKKRLLHVDLGCLRVFSALRSFASRSIDVHIDSTNAIRRSNIILVIIRKRRDPPLNLWYQ